MMLPCDLTLPRPKASPFISQAVFDELCSMIEGGQAAQQEFKKGRTNIVMFVGLQGEGQCMPWRW